MSAVTITTLLEAFKAQVKPGSVEEQSIHTAYDLAGKGDVATATNILKYIKIPEALKIQILAAAAAINPERNFTSTPVTGASSLSTSAAVTPPKTLPEPLMSITGNNTSSSPAPEAVPEPAPAHGAFETELGSVVPPVTAYASTQIQSGVSGVPGGNAGSIGMSIPATSATASGIDPMAGIPIPMAPSRVISAKVVPPDPMKVPAHERGQVWNSVFARSRSGTAGQTSKPMIMEDAKIPVIHTYAEPQPSQFAQKMQQSQAASAGTKLFAAFANYVQRALASDDTAVRMSARTQWNNLNAQFPDYQHLHPQQWNELSDQVGRLSETESSPAAEAGSSHTVSIPDTMPVDAAVSVELPPQSAPEAPMKVPDTSPSSAAGGYFARTKVITSEPSHVTVPALDSGVSVGDSVHQEEPELRTNSKFSADASHDVSPIVSPFTSAATSPVVTQLDEHTLDCGVSVEKNLTITGNSIYRVVRIEKGSDNVVTVVFTDEVREYRIPESELDSALRNPDIAPDDFFTHYKPASAGVAATL